MLMKVHIKSYTVIYTHIVHNLPLLALYMQHTSKLQGSAVGDFIQLTAFNLCHDKDKIKWEPIVGYQYTVHLKVI